MGTSVVLDIFIFLMSEYSLKATNSTISKLMKLRSTTP